MRIINTTGDSKDTQILDDRGRDITAELKLTKIVIEAGDFTRVTLTCTAIEIDVVGDVLKK